MVELQVEESDRPVYLIYAHPWVTWSAGVRVLHFLCDFLNSSGVEAYLVLHGPYQSQETSDLLRTPMMNQDLLDQFLFMNRKLVAIYPESIPGNPLHAPFVIRWILNFPALLAGDTTFEGETVLAYSRVILEHLPKNQRDGILFIPAVKYKEMKELAEIGFGELTKKFELVYAQKYRALGGKPKVDSANLMEITRFGKRSPSRSETLRLVANASVVHAFENTTLITEALILGTPVICHKNRFFNQLIAQYELDMSGISWNPKVIIQPDAKKNLKLLQEVESEAQEKINLIFSSLVLKSQAPIGQLKIVLPRRRRVTRHSLIRARAVLFKKGPIVLLRFTWNYLFR